MKKFKLLVLLLLAVFCLQYSFESQAAQTINGKALGSVDDIVKEVNKGDLSLKKQGLITVRGLSNNDNTYIDVFATTFGKDGTASSKRKIWSNPTPDTSITKVEEKPRYQKPQGFSFWFPHSPNGTVRVPVYTGEPKFFRPAVSRKLYNGKRALMLHNLAPNGSLKYFFKTLSNNRTEHSDGSTLDTLVNSLGISDFGTYTSPKFSNAENGISEVYGTGVMSVKGYDREIFVAASGVSNATVDEGYRHWIFGWNIYRRYVDYNQDNEVRLEFFALNADSEGKMTQEPLTALTQNTPFRGQPKIVSLAVGDFDGDKYNNEVALMINTKNDIQLFVYRLNYSDGKLTRTALGKAEGIHVFSTSQWANDLERQPVTDMVAEDFDGDGTDEIALLFKISNRSDAQNIKDERGWPEGPMVGDIHCKIHKWNANKGDFDTEETAQSYTQTDVANGTWDEFPQATVGGVVGLRAAAADLDGDGKSEIVTLLLGYYHRKAWDSKIKAYKLRRDDFYAYPHLAVWRFDRGSIKPVHDSHVKGGGEGGQYRYNWGKLYDMSDNKGKGLLMNSPHLEYRYIWYNKIHDGDNRNEGTNPDNITYMYVPREFSIAAGPFTGTLGQAKTVDDIAVAWNDKDGNDCVTVFKTKLNAAKQFDGFEDGKLALQDKIGFNRWRGLVAVDFAGEGVELGTPTHLRKTSNRSYIAALNAIPYHVDNVNSDGTALTKQPTNFTYSDALNGGSMTVTYGKTTTDSKTDTVKQDLSQSVETMFAADPEAKGGETFGTIKGLVGFASAIGDIAHGISVGNMSPEDRQRAVWQPESPTAGLNEMMEFFTDKVETVDQRTNSETSTTTIDKNITATTNDAILYTETARHIWRYPVLTRPIPMWLAWGPRIDSTQIDNPAERLKNANNKEMFLTFTMSENSPIRTSSSIEDSMYQPFHEEGNFFSYPPNVADVEGYNDAGILADENTWEFGSTLDNTGMTFTKATSNMQHTEKNVTPSGFTMTTSFFDRLINGDKASGIKMPDSDNPKTFTKEYSKSERISYSLQGSSELKAMQAADHRIKMQPFVAKEGVMALGTAVELSSTNYAKLWASGSIYQQKSDPALLLPQKFVKSGAAFQANTYDLSAMKIRGVRFYMPDFAFFTDNRLVNGQNYEIRVPLYNASFKDTGSFNVRLSWADGNSPTATKTPIATTSVTLGGWSNTGNRNKGTAIFNWKPNLKANKQYYFYVEIDPDNKIDEVHEGRYQANNTTINDYGGNNTGFYPFYIYDQGDIHVSSSGVITANASTADDEINLTPLSFTDSNGEKITDMEAFIKEHSDESFVTITANFNYSGPEVPYGFFVGYLLSESGKQKLPNASLNTIVDLNALDYSDVEDVFMLQDIALFNGMNKVTFTVSPSELLNSASEIAAAADSATFGVISLTNEEIENEDDEEYYEGVDPTFTLDPIPDNVVSESVTKTYTLTANENVFWNISSVILSDTASTADSDDESEDDRDYLDITIERISDDVTSDDIGAPNNYGKNIYVTVSTIAGYTPKGNYDITVQKSGDGDEWTNAEVLKVNTTDGGSEGGIGETLFSSSSSGCNTGIGFIAFAFVAFTLKKSLKSKA